jgi:hypothetical protein
MESTWSLWGRVKYTQNESVVGLTYNVECWLLHRPSMKLASSIATTTASSNVFDETCEIVALQVVFATSLLQLLEVLPLVNNPCEFIIVILSNFNKRVYCYKLETYPAGFDPNNISALCKHIAELVA